ncbi:MAG: glycosyltransferase family 4 protein [Desulfobaccales bacterium]
MRILIHDYSGHPFQVQLSRALARRNHEVLHLYCSSFQTPRGIVQKLDTDGDNFSCRAIELSRPFEKYKFVKRFFQEIEYGKLLVKEVDKFKPDILISANNPLDPQRILLRYCVKNNIKFIFWLQDIYGFAIKKLLTKKLSILGQLIGSYYVRSEFSMLRDSDRVITISEDFVKILSEAKILEEKIDVVHNWAPLEELEMKDKDNIWSREHGLHDKVCIVYTGTLGLKHNPELLVNIALALKDQGHIRIVVVSEGLGADFLKKKKEEFQLNNLIILDFQPFELMPEVMATADVLIAILDRDAGFFSVPSKVLTYHCAGRPLLLSVPEENLAARLVETMETGIVVPPHENGRFLQEVKRLIGDGGLREKYGKNARRYAESAFDIEKITDKFEKVLKEMGES